MTGTLYVGTDGLRTRGYDDEPLRVLFDGTPVWAFVPSRDGERHGTEFRVNWPPRLRPYLDGAATVTVARIADGEELITRPVRFGDSDTPISIHDENGNPLSIDKAGRLQRTFADFTDAERHDLALATKLVLDALRDRCGLEAHLAYGGLLGAVRSGHFIGHDSDSDVSYLSRHTHPFDVIRESLEAERVLRAYGAEQGWRLQRLSAANLKLRVPTPAGRLVGIDVFGAFYVGDLLHITGNVRGSLERHVIEPAGTVELEGVELPAPARVEEYLEFIYGPGWRVPDPSFHFAPSRTTIRRMSGWLRPGRTHYRRWQNFYLSSQAAEIPENESDFARWVAERLPAGARVVELGCGTGRDSRWLAARGFKVIGTDYAGAALQSAREGARRDGVRVRFTVLNLESTRSWLLAGAKLAHRDGPTQVYARGIIDALEPTARPALWRFCSMAGRSGGSTWLEFRTPRSIGEPTRFVNRTRTYADPGEIVAEIEAAGGRVIEKLIGRGLARLGKENPEICRIEVRWDR